MDPDESEVLPTYPLFQRIAVEDPESIVCGTRKASCVLVEAHVPQPVPVRVVFAEIHCICFDTHTLTHVVTYSRNKFSCTVLVRISTYVLRKCL